MKHNNFIIYERSISILTAKKLVLWVMAFVLMSSFVVTAFAISPIYMEEIVTLSKVNPYEYGTVPDEIYMFIYRGTAPYLSFDIDTSTCALNRLYVYNEIDNSVVEISEQNVKEYTTTMDALFYVTVTNEIYKSDYTGQCEEFIYRGDNGSVENIECYYDMFVFTQDDNIILMDLATRTTQILWTCSDIDYFVILSDTELLIVTLHEEFYVYDILFAEPRTINAEEVNYRMAQMRPSSDDTANSDASVMTVYPGGLECYENDISFPLPEYPVNYESSTYYKNYHYPDPASWFHMNSTLEGCSEDNCARYAGTGECMGFARYVHDKYNHMLDYTITGGNSDQWYVGKNMHHAVCDQNGNLIFPYYFDGDEGKVREFFKNIQTGNYVRYGRYDDSSIDNGTHSMVLVGKGSNGIWVYECNQNYYKDLDSDRINGRPKSFFGCGVHLQYHTYDTLKDRYNFVVKYTSHTYTESPVYDNDTYHKVGCTCCAGYVRQKHNNVSATFMGLRHRTTFNCCGGNTAYAVHTGTLTHGYYSKTQHISSATCCSGYRLEDHTFVLNPYNHYFCSVCGYGEGVIIAGVGQMPVSK